VEPESLDQLKSAFGSRRKQKRTRSESIPPELLERARVASLSFGVNAVRRTLNIDRRLIEQKSAKRGRPRKMTAAPSYSRLEISARGAVSSQPVAEFESASGSKLRVFSMTPEAMGLLSSLCGTGGGR
jgi:hypothetical protein